MLVSFCYKRQLKIICTVRQAFLLKNKALKALQKQQAHVSIILVNDAQINWHLTNDNLCMFTATKSIITVQKITDEQSLEEDSNGFVVQSELKLR